MVRAGNLWNFGTYVHTYAYLVMRFETASWNELRWLSRDLEIDLRPGANPTKHDFHNFTHVCKIFLTNMCKNSYKFVKIESYQIFMNICNLKLAYFTSIIQWIGSKWVWKNYADKKLQICKMSKLKIFVITNIFNQIFVTFGRIGTRSQSYDRELQRQRCKNLQCVECVSYNASAVKIYNASIALVTTPAL
jgi:hypothetical protein